MALPLNQLGDFTFITLVGNPVALSEQLELIQRSGLDGTMLRKLGKRGTPFELVGQVDVADLAAGRELYRQYLALKGADPVPLTWHDCESTAEDGALVAVLDVQIRALHKIGPSAGGLTTNPGAFLESGWSLIAVAPLE